MTSKRIATAIAAAPKDPFQRAVQRVVTDERLWITAEGASPEERAAARKHQVETLFAGAEQVDLVGHSTPIRRYLKLGDWILDPTEAARLGSYLPASVTRVRLIGCATTQTDKAKEALAALSRSGRNAFGTINKVYVSHFDRDGVKRGVGAPPLRQIVAGDRGVDAVPARRSPAAQALSTVAPAALLTGRRRAFLKRLVAPITQPLSAMLASVVWTLRFPFAGTRISHRHILRLLSPLRTSMPGLLTEPLLRYDVMSAGQRWRLEILYDFEYARFYRPGQDLGGEDYVYKIRGYGVRTLLEKYLALAPGGIVEIDRHPEAALRPPLPVAT